MNEPDARPDPFRLDGRTALIAGASRGIGLAIARALAAAGAETILVARSADALDAAVASIVAEGGVARSFVADTTDPDAVARLVEALPPIDIHIPVVGTNHRKAFIDYDPDEIESLRRINVDGVVDLTQRVGRRMIERGAGGKVIFIGSATAVVGLANLAIYAMAKGGLLALSRALAAEWARHDIQVNAIIPGFIETGLTSAMWEPQDMHDWLGYAQPNTRRGRPEEIAPVAVFLASPASDYVTGQAIAADGGFSTTSNWPFPGDPTD